MANEKRLIDANVIEAKIEKSFRKLIANQSRPDLAAALSYVCDLIIEAPTVDAVEVVHGYWIDSTNVDHMGRIIEHGIDCSVCDSVFKDDSREVVKRWKERFEICPFCGAMMDGGNEDGG